MVEEVASESGPSFLRSNGEPGSDTRKRCWIKLCLKLGFRGSDLSKKPKAPPHSPPLSPLPSPFPPPPPKFSSKAPSPVNSSCHLSADSFPEKNLLLLCGGSEVPSAEYGAFRSPFGRFCSRQLFGFLCFGRDAAHESWPATRAKHAITVQKTEVSNRNLALGVQQGLGLSYAPKDVALQSVLKATSYSYAVLPFAMCRLVSDPGSKKLRSSTGNLKENIRLCIRPTGGLSQTPPQLPACAQFYYTAPGALHKHWSKDRLTCTQQSRLERALRVPTKSWTTLEASRDA